MAHLQLIACYVLGSIFFKWLLSWGGAERIKGWPAFFLIDWRAGDWDEEQIRFYALLAWICWTIFCGLMFFVD
ncbi:MAG: hypothetical protein Q4A84_04570 [Neisseria sp.]|uniref:hypothetical protein n=1 Tax=Neisseria sp. TaxID=192066 RepID=UPI0026DBA9EF|nr:hypothetical protein [Neisseria sp.]MDO4640963.1 hypothetical protein [Neisseria sp.]